MKRFRILLAALAGSAVALQGAAPEKKNARKDGAEGEKKTAKAPAAPEPKADGDVSKAPVGGLVPLVSTIEENALEGYEHYPPQLQQLIRQGLALTRKNLGYTFGSADPGKGGMDCSGTIYHLLREAGLKDVPRQSDEICGWVRDRTLLVRPTEADSLAHAQFAALRPGDLLFWSGTYQTAPRDIPVTHVMLYLGKLKKTAKPVMFGASDGRVYQGERRSGVSVFDFTLPRVGGAASFYGYGMIPGVGKIEVKLPAVTETVPPLPPADENKAAGTAMVEKPAADVPASKVTPAEKTASAGESAEKPANAKDEVRKAVVVRGTEAPDKAKDKAKAGTSRPKSAPAKKRTAAPPPPPSAQQNMQKAAGRVTDSVKKALSR